MCPPGHSTMRSIPMVHELPDSLIENNKVQAVLPAPAAPRRVLIVDDDEATCKHLQALLQTNASLEVTFQTDGQKALAELGRADYSIAITDLRMPSLDGMELIQEIQRRRMSVSVIVTTGYGS